MTERGRTESVNLVKVAPSSATQREINVKVAALMLLLCFLWGGNSVSIKIGLGGVPPIGLAGMRFVAGVVSIFCWCLLNFIPLKIERGELPHLCAMTAIFTAQIAALNVGTNFTTAGRSIVFISTHPFFVAILASFFVPGDALNIRKLIGLILAFCGVYCVLSDKWVEGMNWSMLSGDLLVLLSALMLGVKIVYTKRLIERINLYKILVWQMLMSLPIFFSYSFFNEGVANYHFSAKVAAAIAYQGIVVAGGCFVGWTLLLKRHSPSKLSAFAFTTPIFGVILSSLLLGESLTSGLGTGGLLVAAGIYIVNRTGLGQPSELEKCPTDSKPIQRIGESPLS